ncbi:uncharacterized protein METZ01_LOCUS319452, partial [marine metagenome]
MKTSKKTLSIAVGTALGASLAMSPVTLADTNPFGASEFSGGYMQIASAHGEGGCGEGKCGDEKGKGEGSCGKDKGDKKAEGEDKGDEKAEG